VLFWKTCIDFKSGSLLVKHKIKHTIINSTNSIGSSGGDARVLTTPTSNRGLVAHTSAQGSTVTLSLSPEPQMSSGRPTPPMPPPSTVVTATNNTNNDGNGVGGAVMTELQAAHQHLLSTIIEANAIYDYYIDVGAPNELNLSASMRHQTRTSLNMLMARAVQGLQTSSHDVTATSVAPLITRRGHSISTSLSLDDSKVLEISLRNVFNQCQDSTLLIPLLILLASHTQHLPNSFHSH
jgi:hypothetical protein